MLITISLKRTNQLLVRFGIHRPESTRFGDRGLATRREQDGLGWCNTACQLLDRAVNCTLTGA